MGIFSRFEHKVENGVDYAADKMFDTPISPVQIAKKAEKQMKRERMVGAGKQYAPTLYTILVNPDDDDRLFGYYPTLAGETETYLSAKAANDGMVMDGQPLVRFIVDESLKHGKFEVIAELVGAPIIKELRAEEMERYGIAPKQPAPRRGGAPRGAAPRPAAPVQPNYVDDLYDDYDGGYESDYLDDEIGDYNRFHTAASMPFEDSSQAQAAFTNYDRDYPQEYAQGYAQNYAQNYAAPEEEDIYYPYSREEFGTAEEVFPKTVAFTPVAGREVAPDPTPKPVRSRLVDRTNRRTYTLAGTRSVIGRETTCNIVINDLNASRKHAEVRMTREGNWDLIDLNSTNGTYVNGRAVERATLVEGDRITIGVTNLVFTQH